jgi:phosphatidylglycerol lysyltransferase
VPILPFLLAAILRESGIVNADQRRRMLDLLKRHGWNSTSFQVMEPEFRYWFDDEHDAGIGYLDTGRAWVVAGAPIAAMDVVPAVVEAFEREAIARGRRVAWFAVEPRFVAAAPMRSLPVGLQAWWDPRRWEERHRGHRGLREQLRRARAKGVHTAELDHESATGRMRPRIEHLIARWLATRPMPPMSFLVALEPFVAAAERRYWIAERNDRLVGLLVAVPVFDRGGWFFEDLLRDPDAPNGTTELLIDAAMRDVAVEGCPFVTLGLSPLAGDARWMRIVRRAMRGFYNFDGVRRFKAKLRPDGWTPIHLAWAHRAPAPVAIHDALAAFASGRPLRFGLLAASRAPAPVLALLGGMLVPWIAVLASAETHRWFSARREQQLWVVFDVAMAAALFTLARRWRRPLALAACAAATGDGIVTVARLATDPVRRVRGPGSALLVAAAALAPFAAAAILLGGLRHRRDAGPRRLS